MLSVCAVNRAPDRDIGCEAPTKAVDARPGQCFVDRGGAVRVSLHWSRHCDVDEAAVLAGEMHAFAGGFEGTAHVIYNPNTDSWRVGPDMPFSATDPAVGAIGKRAYVIGGRPNAHTQIFDADTNAWIQGEILPATGGVDNTVGAVLGASFYVVGGFNGTTTVSTNWRFHVCEAGKFSSAALVPFVIDGDGHVNGVGNERTALLIDNALSGSPMSATCFLYDTGGAVLGQHAFSVASGELKTITDVVRVIRGSTEVQNLVGSMSILGTEVFQSMVSIVNNRTTDTALEQSQSLAGLTDGYIPTVQKQIHTTQTAFANASSHTALLELIAYPPEGGDVPAAATLSILAPHALLNYPSIVSQLGLPAGFAGQLTFSSNQPIGVFARDTTHDKEYSEAEPIRVAADAASTIAVPYVEDSAAFSTRLEISNPGSYTANVTVRLVTVADPTGGSSGVESTRDLTVAVNSAMSLADVVRWVVHDTGTTPTGKRGFIEITTPQAVTAQARIVDTISQDPATPDNETPLTSGFSPLIIRVEPLTFAVKADDSIMATDDAVATAASTISVTRFALANPGTTPATVELVPLNSSGSPALAQPFVVTLAPNGQFFTENLGAAIDLPPVFLGSISIRSDAPVFVYNHRRTGQGGSAVPVYSQ